MRAILAILSLAIVAVLAWLLLPAGGDRVTAPVQAAAETAAMPATGSAPADALVPTAAPTPATPENRRLAPPTDGKPANVRVVRFGSDAGVPGVTVRFQRPDGDWQRMSDAERQEYQRLASDEDARLRRYGSDRVTDADGACFVPPGEHGTRVVARNGDLYADGYVSATAKEPAVLALRPDCTLHVLIVDAAGRPAPGIRVQATRIPGSAPVDPQWHTSTWSFAETDSSGRCQQLHFQNFASKDASLVLDLCAVLPGGTGPTQRVEVTAPPPEVILHLPAAGSVTVHVRDIDGRPLDVALLGGAEVDMAASDKAPANDGERVDALNRGRTSAALDANSDARFPCVMFDRTLVVQFGNSLTQVTCPGPTLSSPAVEVTLRESRDDVILTGVLTQGEGTPLASKQLTVKCAYERGFTSRNLRTGTDGRVRVNLSSYPKDMEVTVGFTTDTLSREDGVAVELPPRRLQAGINDLGEVRLLPFAVLVAGRLRCDDGVSVRQVQVDIERKQQDGRWAPEYNLNPRWLPDGSFSLRSGISAGVPMRLVVREGSYLPVEPIEFVLGATGIEIPLRIAGSATATLVVDADLPVQLLAVRLERTAPPEDLDSRQRMMRLFDYSNMQVQDGRASRKWAGLSPGTYRLTVDCQGSGAPFVTVDGIRISGGECPDPRLRDIDLRGRVRTLEVRATANGAEVVDDAAFVLVKGKGDTWNGYTLARGVARIAAAAAVDLLVVAKGFEMAHADAVATSCSVPLQPAKQAQICVMLPAQLPDGVQLRLVLQPELGFDRRLSVMLDNGRGMGAENFFAEEVVVGSDGTAAVTVRWPGEYSVSARLDKDGRGGWSLRGFEPRTVKLPADGVTALRVLPKDLEATLQRLQK